VVREKACDKTVGKFALCPSPNIPDELVMFIPTPVPGLAIAGTIAWRFMFIELVISANLASPSPYPVSQ
jgi:hypothetical protein